MSTIEAQDYSLKNLLGSWKTYKVPLFQRSYSWEIENAETLLEDINEILDLDEELFIGAMIFTSEDNDGSFKVLDWQQRFSTLLLFLAALRDVLSEINKNNKSFWDTLEKRMKNIEKYLFSEHDITMEMNITFTLNQNDRKVFEKLILQRWNPTEKKIERSAKKSNKKLFKNYEYFYKKLLEKFSNLSTNDLDIELQKLLKVIYDKVRYIDIQVSSTLDATKVFESINHKWVKLSSADLIKNLIFWEIDSLDISSKDEILREKILHWDKISDSWINVVSFIRHYWLSRFEDSLSVKNLYKKIKDKIIQDKNKTWGQQNLLNLLDDIYTAAEIYRNLKSPEYTFWKNNDIIKSLTNLNYLRTDQTNILLLACYDKFFKNDDFQSFVKCIDLLENFIFRRNTILHWDAKQLESLYSNLAKRIRNEKWDIENPINSVEEIQWELSKKKYFPSDEQFKIWFLDFDTNNRDLAKYILIKLYNDDLRDLKIEYKFLELEHIIPQSYEKNEEWIQLEKTEKERLRDENFSLEEYVEKIWNYTLLLSSDNKTWSNNSFNVKKEKTYSKSNIPANLKINEYVYFSVDQINERQEEFAKKAVQIWKI